MAVALRTLSRARKTTKANPENDPRYRRVVEQLKLKSAKIKQHPTPARKAAEAAAAAKGPVNEKKAGAKANQVDKIKEAKEKKPEANSFLALLRAEIEKAMPKTLGDTEKFMKGGSAEAMKGTLKGNVTKQKEEATGDVKSTSRQTPSEAGVAGKQVKPIPGEPAPPSPAVAGGEAMPAPKPDAEISLQDSKADTDQAMKDAEVTDTQLQKANDPRFSAVLSAKGDVAKQADAAPAQYRANEQATLARAASLAGADAKKNAVMMIGVKASSKSAVLTRQQIAKAKDEAARKKVADDIEAIYTETKNKVEQKLSSLEEEVNRIFDRGTDEALKKMKDYVELRIARYKFDRYLSIPIVGAARWVRDQFKGLPEEANDFYVEGRTLFTLLMNMLIVQVSKLVETRLEEAKKEVAKGQARIKAYVAGLPKNLQSVGRDAQKAVAGGFEDLEREIEDKKNQLAQQLAQKGKDASEKADTALKEIQDANKGLVQKFIEKLGEIIRILREFKEKVMAMLKKAEATIKLILLDPIGFLKNMLKAIKKGIGQFIDNFTTHLKAGFFEWLFGSLAEAGITVPKDFSLPSILKLVLDVLGLTYDRLRAKAVKLIGARNVAMIEKIATLIKELITGGLPRLWEMAKEYLTNLKETIMEEIRSWLIAQIVKAAMTKLLSMFNPVGAIIQAIMMIYNTVMFFIENINRILQFVQAVIDSIYDMVVGSIDKAANWIEKALAKMIPILIAFLARLLGISGITDKIKSVIKKIQDKVDKAIDKVIEKLVNMAKKLFRVIKTGAKKILQWWKKRKKFNVGNESHELSFRGENANALLIVSSDPKLVEDFVNLKERTAKSKAAKEAVDEIRKSLKKITWEIKKPEEEQNADVITELFNNIGEKLALLMSGQDWGAEDDPVLLNYPKPRLSVYAAIYLGPHAAEYVSQTTLQNTFSDPNAKNKSAKKLFGNAVTEKAWEAVARRVRRYVATQKQQLPHKEDELGIDADKQVQVGLRFEYTPSKTKGGRKLNSLLKLYGFRPQRDNMDADHVLEIQLIGLNKGDYVGNLWPLRAEDNRHGLKLSEQEVELPGQSKKTVKLGEAAKKKKLWIMIKSTR